MKRKEQTLSYSMLRGSERGDFKTCQQMWWWGWREGWKSPSKKMGALWFGTGIHLALAHHYQPQGKGALRGFRRGPHPAETWDKWAAGQRGTFFPKNGPGTVDEKDFIDSVDLGHAMLEHYIDYYGDDSAWEVLAPEMPFSVLLPDHDGHPLLNYVGTFDCAYRDHEDGYQVKIAEHKSAASVNVRYATTADQPKGYALAAEAALRDAGLLKGKEQVRWITYNILRKAAPDTRPQNENGHYLNQDGSVSKRQPPAFFKREPIRFFPEDHNMTLQHMINEARQMDLIRQGVVEPTKNPGFMSENCRRCDFAEMCMLHEQNEDWEEFADNFLIRRDPYADHRKDAVNSKFM